MTALGSELVTLADVAKSKNKQIGAVAEVLVKSVMFSTYLQLVASELTVMFGINPLILCVDAGLFTFTFGGIVSLTNAIILKLGTNMSTERLSVLFQHAVKSIVKTGLNDAAHAPMLVVLVVKSVSSAKYHNSN